MAGKSQNKSRTSIITAVRTPIGFFVLCLLVLESILLVVANNKMDTNNVLIVLTSLAIILLTVLAAAFLFYSKPGLFVGQTPEILVKQEVPVKGNAYQAKKIQDILQLKLNAEEMLDEMIELDYEEMDEITVEHEGSRETIMKKWFNYPDTGRILLDQNHKAVGYWSFIPMFDEPFEEFKNGKGFDGKITADEIPSLEMGGVWHLYFLGIGLKRDHKNLAAKKELALSFAAALRELATHKIYFEDMCANAFTKYGESLCKTLDMEKLCDHIDKGSIYYRKLYPLPQNEIFKKERQLKSLYDTKFGAAIEE